MEHRLLVQGYHHVLLHAQMGIIILVVAWHVIHFVKLVLMLVQVTVILVHKQEESVGMDINVLRAQETVTLVLELLQQNVLHANQAHTSLDIECV